MYRNTVTIKPLQLEILMAENNLRRKHLADKAGIGVTTVSNICRGNSCSVRTAVAIARALNVDVQDIITQ